jgi:hypothetical protein
MLSYKLYRGEL